MGTPTSLSNPREAFAMDIARTHFDRLDAALTLWMAERGIALLRISLGAVFLWFGVLKFFAGVSPAEALVLDTMEFVTFGLIDPRLALRVLAVWETLIGLGLITGIALRATLLLLFLQMPGTALPLLLFPELTFQVVPFVLTIEGQYIVKNLVLVTAGFVIGSTVRGGRLVPED
ncbi:MAG: DoxX family protein [Gemmatimonadota bacterium]